MFSAFGYYSVPFSCNEPSIVHWNKRAIGLTLLIRLNLTKRILENTEYLLRFFRFFVLFRNNFLL